MNKKLIEDFTQLTADLVELITSQQTLLLATATTHAIPDLSYAPFVQDNAGSFYIFVSDLASHTTNLRGNPQASVMFIRPESESPNLFARERASFNCRVTEITRDNALYDAQLQALQDKFGETVKLLRSLSDFHLLALTPEQGRYVAGFGRAYKIIINKDHYGLEHLRSSGSTQA